MDHPLLLIADNDEDDLFLLQRAMTRLRILNPCEEVRTGEEVKDYFKRTGRFANRIAYPQAVGVILLLDAHLPTISGVEVVGWIRQNQLPELMGVLVWTGSANPRERLAMREVGFSCVDKPLELPGYEQLFNRFPGLKLENVAGGKVLRVALAGRTAEIILRAF
jgi:CheY-like chemotaxis protein